MRPAKSVQFGEPEEWWLKCLIKVCPWGQRDVKESWGKTVEEGKAENVTGFCFFLRRRGIVLF